MVNVKDTGQGIEYVAKVIHKIRVSAIRGTILFISKGIVEAQLGKIWGKNNVDGIGATFSFTLPAM
jgi:signal transduction histidine kinase